MSSQKAILVVDDEQKILEVVSSYLESKGYTVFTAENGRDALSILESQTIVIIVLDLMLPDLSGEEICSIIRKKSRVPIIMLTAKTQEDDMLNGLHLGADDYITKPFSLKELYARIEVVLRRSSNEIKPLTNKYSWNDGDLIIDFEHNEVKKAGETITLTPSEWKIITALVKNPQKVFSRNDLINIAFDMDFDGYDRVIDTHIKNLRKKIETDSRKPVYVKTSHGLGYKFGGEIR